MADTYQAPDWIQSYTGGTDVAYTTAYPAVGPENKSKFINAYDNPFDYTGGSVYNAPGPGMTTVDPQTLQLDSNYAEYMNDPFYQMSGPGRNFNQGLVQQGYYIDAQGSKHVISDNIRKQYLGPDYQGLSVDQGFYGKDRGPNIYNTGDSDALPPGWYEVPTTVDGASTTGSSPDVSQTRDDTQVPRPESQTVTTQSIIDSYGAPAESNYDWSQITSDLPNNVVPFDQFDFQAYAQANPEVLQNPGFTGQGQYDASGENPTPTQFDALYAHYVGRFPDNPSVSLGTHVSNYEQGEFQQRDLATQQYTDPNTGSIRADLLGGQFTDPQTIPLDVLKERQELRAQGYQGEWGTGQAGQFKEGAYRGAVDQYGNQTIKGRMEDQAFNPTLPEGARLDPTLIQEREQDFLTTEGKLLDPNAIQAQMTSAQYNAATASDKTAAGQYTADNLQLTDEATVQGQLADLYGDFEGGQVPAWAAGAIRSANQIMAARGMGASSIAGQAITQAAMEAALPIAQADAAVNAQALFTQYAAQNAAKQFNAQSQQQNDQFFANLETQVSTFNAEQQNTIERFNAGEANALAEFNAGLRNQREQFNSSMRLQIDQSNVQWRRQINTANTAAINAANQFNASNVMQMSQTAMNNLWQEWRDIADFSFQAQQNQMDRDLRVALQVLQNQGQLDAIEANDPGILGAVAGVAGSVLGAVAGKAVFG